MEGWHSLWLVLKTQLCVHTLVEHYCDCKLLCVFMERRACKFTGPDEAQRVEHVYTETDVPACCCDNWITILYFFKICVDTVAFFKCPLKRKHCHIKALLPMRHDK